MAMTSKERLMTALGGGKPDRLPATVHQWQGYHLNKYLGGIDDLAAFKQFGLDAQIQYFELMGQFWLVDADFSKFSTDTWVDDVEAVSDKPDDRVNHHVIHTPEGDLTYKTAGNQRTTWITEYLVKTDDDMELVRKFMPVPKLDLAPIAARHDEIGDDGILRGFVWGDQAGCWAHACCIMDINELILRAIDEPDWMHYVLKILLDKKLQFIESMKGAKLDLVETGGGAGSSTVISPDFHKEFCLPYDRAMHDALHELGFLTTYHTCGGNFGLEDHIVDNHCDASETVAPISVGGNQEPWDFAAKIDGRVAMIGGVDQFNTLTRGTPESIRADVQKLFETCGAKGGYLCSMADHFFETDPANIQAFADAAKECVY
ncbi:MAG: uroporphyrinogen decarboxylase family protein [Planctomycetota bacterium]